MAGQYSVKETKEAMIAIVAVGKLVVDRMKDGVGFDDAAALASKFLGDAEFKAKVMAGVDGIALVPKEIGEMDLADLLEMAKVIPEILAELKK